MPFRKLFLSRWAALLWAGGMIWTAADTVGFGPPVHFANDATPDVTQNADDSDATGVAVNTDDLATLANAMKSE